MDEQKLVRGVVRVRMTRGVRIIRGLVGLGNQKQSGGCCCEGCTAAREDEVGSVVWQMGEARQPALERDRSRCADRLLRSL